MTYNHKIYKTLFDIINKKEKSMKYSGWWIIFATLNKCASPSPPSLALAGPVAAAGGRQADTQPLGASLRLPCRTCHTCHADYSAPPHLLHVAAHTCHTIASR